MGLCGAESHSNDGHPGFVRIRSVRFSPLRSRCGTGGPPDGTGGSGLALRQPGADRNAGERDDLTAGAGAPPPRLPALGPLQEHTHRPGQNTHTQTLHSIPPSPRFSAFTTDICLCMRLLIMQHKDKMYITETVMHFFVTVSHSSCKCYLGGYHGGLRSYLNQCI